MHIARSAPPTIKVTLAVAVLALALGACGGGGRGGGIGVNPPPAPAKLEDQFGSIGGFGSIFRQGPNTEPTDPAAGAVVPVNVTAEPVPVP